MIRGTRPAESDTAAVRESDGPSTVRRGSRRAETRGTSDAVRAWTERRSPASGTPSPSRLLQQTRGNQAVQRAVNERLHPKLAVGAANDEYEQEADRVADAVLSTPDRRGQCVDEADQQHRPRARRVQRECSDCADEETLRPRRAVRTTRERSTSVSPEIADRVPSSSGGGRRLPPRVRDGMARKMGADFDDVRIHTGSRAAQLSRRLGARAFTYGRDIYFNAGEYAPESPRGKRLLAHELAHTVQQKRGTKHAIQRAVCRREERTVPGFPETYIQHVDVDVTSPASIRCRWTGPNASDHDSGPFEATVGDGAGTSDCNDVEESNEPGSNCTPKGDFTIERQACSLGNHDRAKNASYFQSARGIAFHYWPNRPDCPASHGCVRLERRVSQVLWDNCINEGTSSEHGQPATTVNVSGTWRPCGGADRSTEEAEPADSY